MAKPMTCEEFKRRAVLVHGQDYDYSDTHYINMMHKVAIRCPIHGVFEQRPQAHLRGQGCPVCGRAKNIQGFIAKYGVDNPMKSKQVQAKARQTCLERYGHEWAMSSDEVRQKAVATNLEKYGVANPLLNPDVKKKVQATLMSRYGEVVLSRIPEIREKMRHTCLEKYGTVEPLASPVIREKIRATVIERYGGPAPMSSSEVQARTRLTAMERYGVPYAVMSPDVRDKTVESKRVRGTFSSSKSEDRLYEMLLGRFDETDIERQYKSSVYPFPCDFYVKSRDLYIELNGLWTHGSHWFDAASDDDKSVVELWSQRGTKYYRNAVHVWTVADVNKRCVARDNNLNYVVFWDAYLHDAELWFSMGCPDGRDWDVPYSWMNITKD